MKDIKVLCISVLWIICVVFAVVVVQINHVEDTLNSKIAITNQQVNEINSQYDTIVKKLDTVHTTLVPLGTFRISYYCNNCDKCGTNNTTTDGTELENGMQSIATDPSVIPSGTIIQIDGKQYVANDTGGKVQGNDIDIMIYGKPHEEVLAMGIDHFVVYAVEKVR